MSDLSPDEASEELWGAPDFEGRTHARPLPDWFSGSKSLLPACRHWREPVGLLDEVVVFASAWFDPIRRGGRDYPATLAWLRRHEGARLWTSGRLGFRHRR
jgi:hypothetical protein